MRTPPIATLETMRTAVRAEIEVDVATLARDLEDKGEDTTPSQHPADVASDLYAREQLESAELALERHLADIEDALGRARHGTYGICADCGGAIAPERLAVIPQAARCIDCQRRTERVAHWRR